MKKLAAMLLLAGCSSVAVAEVDYGVGLSVKDSDSSIYLPIDVSASWRVEPSIGYYHFNNDDDQSFFSSKYESVELLVGLFKKKVIADNFQLLYGLRTGYFRTETDNFDSFDEKIDGYVFVPTVGFEYSIIKNFSIGGEVGLSYRKFNKTQTRDSWFGDTKNHSSYDTLTTTTALSARFYF